MSIIDFLFLLKHSVPFHVYLAAHNTDTKDIPLLCVWHQHTNLNICQTAQYWDL